MNRDEAIKNIIRAIKDEENGNRIVPVLGSNCFYVRNGQNQEVSLQQFVVELLLPDGLDKESFSKCLMGFKGLSYLKRLLGTDSASIRSNLYRNITENKSLLSKVHLKEEVKEFVERGQFPLIIVTTTIPVIKLLPFSELRILINKNIKKNSEAYKAIYYKKENKTSQDIVRDPETEKLTTPVIYHIFGSFITDDQCVLSENDFLDYLHCLHDSSKRPNQLYNYLEDKYLLMLGCEIPDWTFRFMLHSLKGTFDDSINKIANPNIQEKFIGGTANDKMDENLKEFLENISYYSDSDIKLFLKDINQALNMIPRLFISYSSHPDNQEEKRDYRDIKEIKIKLDSKFHTWFFEDEPSTDKVGIKYWNKIQDGLKNSEYIIFVITHNVLEKLRNTSVADFGPVRRDDNKNILEDNGIITEWKIVLEILNNPDYKGKVLIKQFTYLLGVSLKDFQGCYQSCKNENGVSVFEPLFAGKQCCMELPEDFDVEMLSLTD